MDKSKKLQRKQKTQYRDQVVKDSQGVDGMKIDELVSIPLNTGKQLG